MQNPVLLQFANPSTLWALAGIPVLLVVARLCGYRLFSDGFKALVTGELCGTVAVIILAAAMPQQVNVAYAMRHRTHTVVGLLDDSLSMTRPWSRGGFDGEASTLYGVFRDELTTFARTRSVDPFGVILFSNGPLVVSQVDQTTGAAAAEKLDGLGARSTGTNVVDGIRAAIAQLKGSNTDGRVLLIMTDGETDLKPAEVEALRQELKELNASIYLVMPDFNVGSPVTEEMVGLVGLVDGQVYPVHDRQDLSRVLVKIGQIEQANMEVSSVALTTNLAPFFIVSALVCQLFCFGALLLARPQSAARA